MGEFVTFVTFVKILFRRGNGREAKRSMVVLVQLFFRKGVVAVVTDRST